MVDIKQDSAFYYQSVDIDLSLRNVINFGQSPIPGDSVLIIFCGISSLNVSTIDAINYLSKLHQGSRYRIALTDRCDLGVVDLHDSVLKIPVSSEVVPEGYSSENFIIMELRAIQDYISTSGLNFDYVIKLRKDVLISVDPFLQFIWSTPAILEKYSIMASTLSTNILRPYCLSDLFFCVKSDYLLRVSFKYRRANSLVKKIRTYLRSLDVYYPMWGNEAFIWHQIISSSCLIRLSNISSWISFLDEYVLVLPPHQMGLTWSRNSRSVLRNWNLFSPDGRYIELSTNPLRDFTSYNSLLAPFLLGDNFLKAVSTIRSKVTISRLFYQISSSLLKFFRP